MGGSPSRNRRQTAKASRPRAFSSIAISSKGKRSPSPGSILIDPGDGDRFPLLEIAIDEKALGRDAFAVCRRLRDGDPPIYVGHLRLPQGKLVIHPMNLDDENATVLTRRLREELVT